MAAFFNTCCFHRFTEIICDIGDSLHLFLFSWWIKCSGIFVSNYFTFILHYFICIAIKMLLRRSLTPSLSHNIYNNRNILKHLFDHMSLENIYLRTATDHLIMSNVFFITLSGIQHRRSKTNCFHKCLLEQCVQI